MIAGDAAPDPGAAERLGALEAFRAQVKAICLDLTPTGCVCAEALVKALAMLDGTTDDGPGDVPWARP